MVLPNLPKQLRSARKGADMSLLEICRQLDITPTYWYKLEKGETGTISYDLLQKIDELLHLRLELTFDNSIFDFSFKESKNMDLSRLNWIKVVTPGKDWPHYWALSPKEISESNEPIIQSNGLTILPLGFKSGGADVLKSGDLMLLTQHARITHVVEVLDEQPYEKGGWSHRYVKINWWQPNLADWHELPRREDVLGFDISIQKGIPYEFRSFETFRKRWDSQGGLDGFREHLTKQLELVGAVIQK
ncbi:helix-turn-helix transcriptional regulator [Nodosilinea sp. P-1105]|uniref:helix-turn-helix domain-containing protein n=1 Tax=Nodosilinea sp. P-1105 TaxID=2546229 RepID=UPI00146E7FA3|nr:helix-turn-helix transcriptional regulator [Nodosilinea sp. P-1105]